MLILYVKKSSIRYFPANLSVVAESHFPMPFKNAVQVSPMHPVCGPNSDVKAGSACANRVYVAFCRLAASYDQIQVSHHGTYSVERLLAFKSYCERTSLARVIAVCLFTPLPALLVAVLLDCIPLRNPEEGWEANYMFWIRFFVSGVIINVGLTYQVQDMVNDLDLSALRVLGIAVMCMGVYVSTVMLVASQWAFPVPFGIILGVGPCFMIYLWVLYLAIGPNQLRANPILANDIKQQLYVLGIQAILITIYPAFNALYFDVSPRHRVGLVLILPFTKFIMKNVVAWSCSHLEEYVPVIEVFSVEVFNALYVSTCMQAVNSEFATLVVIALDAVHGALAFRALRQMTLSVHQHQSLLKQPAGDSKDIVTTALTTALHLQAFRTRAGKLIRVRSPLKRSIEGIHSRQLEKIAIRQQIFAKLEAQTATAERITKGSTKVSRIQSKLERASSGRVGPSPLFVVVNKKQPSFEQFSDEALQAEVVESSLRLLFRCEYLALVEYVECAVPLLFGIYLSILTGLSSREYYPQTRDMVPGQLEKTLTNLCMYVALEVASFIITQAIVKRRVGLSAIYQVAFVLETQLIQLQSRLFVWIIFILQFTLQHYGVDFTFRFTWMNK